jgi:sugar/nucleoside kinase (ribokinase family)
MKMLTDSGDADMVCIHFPEGAYARERSGSPIFVPSHDLPRGFIKGTVGAGDAFCAGMLYGIHEEWDLERSLRLANAMAAVCLSEMSASGGMKPLEPITRFMEEMPLRSFEW